MSPEDVGRGSRCPVCAAPVEGEARRCERCDTPHHVDCWDYLGGCGVFGCAGAPRPRALSSSPSSLSSSSASPRPPLTTVVTGWAAAVRWQAYGDLLLGLTLLGVVLGPVVGLTGGALLLSFGPSRVDALVWLPQLAAVSLALGLASAVLVLLWRLAASWHGRRIDRRLEGSLEGLPPVDRRVRDTILARLDLGGGEGRLLRLARLSQRMVLPLRLAIPTLVALYLYEGRCAWDHLRGGGLAHYLRVSLGNHPFVLSLLLVLLGVAVLSLAVATTLAAAGRRLVLLETTLNRVEALGKGKS